MTIKKQPIYKPSLFLLSLTLFALIFIPSIVNAESITVDLIYTSSSDTTMEVTGTGSGGINPFVDYWGFNFDNLTNPTDVIWLTNSVKYPYQSGTFSATVGTATMSGTYQMINGSFSGYQQQFWFHFTSFNKGSETGINTVHIIGSPPLPSDYISRNTVTQTGLTPIYCSGISDGGVKAYGSYIVRDNTYAYNTITAADAWDSSFVTISVAKHNYPSLIKVFSGNTVPYQETGMANILDFGPILITKKPVIFQAYLLGHYVNSTEYFYPSSYSYNISYSPEYPQPNSPITTTISSNGGSTGLANLKYISISAKSDYNAGNEFIVKNSINQERNFLKFTNETWGEYNGTYGYIASLGGTTPNGFTFNLPASGNWTIRAELEDILGRQTEIIQNMTVLGNTGQLSLSVYPISGTDGGFISGAQVNVLDMQTNNWTNKTVISAPDCRFYVSPGFYKYSVFASDVTYSNTNQGLLSGVFITNKDIFRTVTLYPLVPEGAIIGDIINSTVYVTVRDPDLLEPIYGATVTITPENKYAKTNSIGVATFTLMNGTTYKATATASGYQTTSISFTPNTAIYSFDITMGFGGVIPTAITPVITTITPIPTITPDAWKEENVTQCGVIVDKTSVIEWLKSKLACMGLKTAISQSLAIAAGIILLCMAFGGIYGKGIGSALGTIIGFILAFAVGLIPFAVVALLISILVLIAFIMIGGKLGNSGG
jgi:hypothetical protein